jgi:phosphorylase kinase alpha/beta subunit
MAADQPAGAVFHPRIASLLRQRYSRQQLDDIREWLEAAGTFTFPALPCGLFPAAHLSKKGKYSGYQYVWVRDSIHVAHALWRTGDRERAVKVVRAFLAFYAREPQRHRFEAIIATPSLAGEPMNRPHIRFDGLSLAEVSETWSHAQNDALGYLLWLACRLIAAGAFVPTTEERRVLRLIPHYLGAIRYWQDADSGHWEEERKVEASSIGVVVGALAALQPLLAEGLLDDGTDARGDALTPYTVEELIGEGQAALAAILPNESIERKRERAYDAALLFLIYPMAVVRSPMADVILRNVGRFLEGTHGIRRYLLDSFWCADYRERVDETKRTADVSGDMRWRDSLVQLGEEAQWCLFDPIVSVIYGRRYRTSGDPEALRLQVRHFNRSLGQLTAPDSGFAELRCPELYFREGNRYQPNDVTPLLWTQANLLLAFAEMQRTAAAEAG